MIGFSAVSAAQSSRAQFIDLHVQCTKLILLSILDFLRAHFHEPFGMQATGLLANS